MLDIVAYFSRVKYMQNCNSTLDGFNYVENQENLIQHFVLEDGILGTLTGHGEFITSGGTACCMSKAAKN